MKYKKLGDDINIPKVEGLPLLNKENVKFNYYMASRIKGNLIDLDITSKIFCNEDIYTRKSCYRVNLGDIENCVKSNTIDHMIKLGIKEKHIPDSLVNRTLKNYQKETHKTFSD